MGSTVLEIEGTKVPLSDDRNGIEIVKQIANVLDFGTRESGYSNTFPIDMTKEMREVTEDVHEPTSKSKKAYKRLSAILRKAGVDMVDGGVVKIMSTQGSKAKINIASGNREFFDILAERLVSDVDLSDYTFTWNWTDYVASHGNIWSDGYAFPIIDYGEGFSGNKVNPAYQLPALFDKILLKAIVEGAGYTISGTLYDDKKFQKRATVYSPVINESTVEQLELFSVRSDLLQTAYIRQGSSTVEQRVALLADNELNDNLNIWTPDYNSSHPFAGPGNYSVFRAPFSGDYTFRASLNYNCEDSGTSAANVEYKIYRNGGWLAWANMLTSMPTGVAKSHEGTKVISLNAGDVVYFDFETTSNAATVIDTEVFQFWLQIDSVSLQTLTYGTSTWDWGHILPVWTQRDWIRGILQQFGSIIQVNETKKTVVVNKFEFETRDSADWTGKLTFNPAPVMSRQVSGYAQENLMKYTEDENVKANLGDGALSINNEHLDLEKELFTLPWAATNMIDNSGLASGTLKIPLIEASAMSHLDVEFVPRAFYIENDNVAGGIDFDDGTASGTVSSNIPFAWFIDTARSESLGFGEDLGNTFYKYVRAVLNDFLLVEGQLNIHEADLVNFDHMKSVYLGEFGAHFFVQKLRQRTTTLPRVELVRINT